MNTFDKELREEKVRHSNYVTVLMILGYGVLLILMMIHSV